MDRSAGVDGEPWRGKIICATKDAVSGVFGLGDARVRTAERSEIRNVTGHGSKDPRVDLGHDQVIGKLLTFLLVADVSEGVVTQLD